MNYYYLFILCHLLLCVYLVPEEEVGLAELEVFNVETLHEGKAHTVKAGVDPAPPRRVLVGHRLTLQLHLPTHTIYAC